jgi:MFS transporter, putative metabolite:H+ symporter
MSVAQSKTYGVFSLPVIVGALGYFVDVYDIFLFSVLRSVSLRELGVAEADLLSTGVSIINLQLIGLLLGGLVYGVLGDKIGRTKLLFASIITYTLATLACAHVQTVDQYMWLRFIAGIGLAGEFGLAITLVSELLPKEKRGYGNTIVAACGVTGIIFAAWVSQHLYWRDCYTLGGVMGAVLLLLRFRIAESFMLAELAADVKRGSLRMFFGSWDRVKRFSCVVLTTGPCLWATWLLGTFAPEITAAMGLAQPITTAEAMIAIYIGIALGEVIIGVTSQKIQSRRKVVFASLGVFAVFAVWFFALPHGQDRDVYLWAYFLLGLPVGYLVISVMITAEIFGTNLRATATTMAPNFMRALFVPMSLAMTALKPAIGLLPAVMAIAAIAVVIAVLATLQLRETYGIDLNYVEK